MKKISLLLAIILTFSMCIGCAPNSGNNGGSSDTERDTLIVAVPESPIYLDPQVNATFATYRVTTNMFDRLVQMDGNMNLVPKLAESWDVVDDKTTIFHLRQGVKFHNGEEMTAEDVKYSLERCIASPGVNFNYLIIDTIEIVDDYTVKVVTKTPFNALLYRLTLDAASIVSKVAAEEGAEAFNKNPVGTGPFKLVSWEIGGDVVLAAHQDYYGGAPAISNVIFRQIPEATNRTIGLETGEVDLAYDLPVVDLKLIEENEALTLMKAPSIVVYHLGFNTKKPIMDNFKVRQAIAYAVNIPDYIDIVFSGEAQDAQTTIIPPGVFGYMPPQNVDYSYNLEKAKELLKEAGYPNGFKTTLWCDDSLLYRDSAVVLQDQLRKIGIEVEIKSQEMGIFYSDTSKGEHDMLIYIDVGIDPDSVLRGAYHTESYGAGGNRTFWSTPEVDAMLDEANTTMDTERAKELYVKIQEIVGEQLPRIPLCMDTINAGMQSYVKGFELYPGCTHSIAGVYFE